MECKVNLWSRSLDKTHCQFHPCKRKLNQHQVMSWKKMSFWVIGKMETDTVLWHLGTDFATWECGLVDTIFVSEKPDVYKSSSENNIHCHFFLIKCSKLWWQCVTKIMLFYQLWQILSMEKMTSSCVLGNVASREKLQLLVLTYFLLSSPQHLYLFISNY